MSNLIVPDVIPIQPRQYEIGGVIMGWHTPYKIMEVVYGDPEVDVSDADVPRADGIFFGRDYLRGRTIRINGRIRYPRTGRTQLALDAYEALEAVWRDPDVMHTSNAVTTLRWKRFEGRGRKAYGRPRKLTSTSKMSSLGDIPFTAEFKTWDHLYYSDEVYINNVQLIPPSVLGLQAPLIAPLHSVALSERSSQVHNASATIPSWIVFEIHGPITSPKVTLTNGWVLDLHGLTLAFDEYVIVDPRPWSRGVYKNGFIPINGALTTQSVGLSDLKLPPGDSELILQGVDITGTAYMNMAWYDTYYSY